MRMYYLLQLKHNLYKHRDGVEVSTDEDDNEDGGYTSEANSPVAGRSTTGKYPSSGGKSRIGKYPSKTGKVSQKGKHLASKGMTAGKQQESAQSDTDYGDDDEDNEYSEGADDETFDDGEEEDSNADFDENDYEYDLEDEVDNSDDGEEDDEDEDDGYEGYDDLPQQSPQGRQSPNRTMFQPDDGQNLMSTSDYPDPFEDDDEDQLVKRKYPFGDGNEEFDLDELSSDVESNKRQRQQ